MPFTRLTAVVMAGRTGAAYAAQLGTMQTNEEIDAIVTMGISPVEFLVMPRMLALVVVMPLLTIYADLLGMIGFIILLGLVVNNAILLVAQTRAAEATGLDRREAVHQALRYRLRPIFMSTLTSLFGMLPLLIVPGAGSEIYRGMAAAIVGGMSVSTLFTLLLLPSLLQLTPGVRQARVTVDPVAAECHCAALVETGQVVGDALSFGPYDLLAGEQLEVRYVLAVAADARIGDATNLSSSKAGSVAHFQSEILFERGQRTYPADELQRF